MNEKYQRIIGYIQNEIDTGHLKPGAKLPSIREAAKLFNCNKVTIIRAYEEMEQNHLLYSVPKSGYYLVDKKAAVISVPDQEWIDFTAATPDTTTFPYIDFQHCLNQAIDLYKENLFAASKASGLASLRETLAQFLPNYQIFTESSRIFVTAGSQQALQLLALTPFPNGKSHILIEQPTYYGMLRCCQLLNITTIGIERTWNGIDLEELERIFSSGNIKFFYTIPRFHNPLGASYSNEQKKQILNLAQKYNVYIVEDDYLADVELDSKSDPIYAFDTTAKVIYVRSFSKTFMSGLRIGVAVLPKLLVNTFEEYKKWADLSTSVISQGALEIFIKSGMLETHIKKIKKLYRERMASLKTACQTHLPPGIATHIPETGFFSCFELPFRAKHLVNSLQNKNIRVVSLEGTYLPDYERNNVIRLSVCRVDRRQIEEGVRMIGEALRGILDKPPVPEKEMDDDQVI